MPDGLLEPSTPLLKSILRNHLRRKRHRLQQLFYGPLKNTVKIASNSNARSFSNVQYNRSGLLRQEGRKPLQPLENGSARTGMLIPSAV
jgi:hypothetical protein